jgi:uncharacterized Fe-S cluster-containing MiaB family protein
MPSALVGESAVRFRDLVGVPLEVAMGLETAHPGVLEKLNKRMTLDLFRERAEFLRAMASPCACFVLVRPPFLDEDDALVWARRSIDFALDCGATVVSLIPTRPGEGALEALAATRRYSPALAGLRHPRSERLRSYSAWAPAADVVVRRVLWDPVWGLRFL